MTKFRILHIDDDHDVRQVVRFVIGAQPDLDLRSCETGREGVALAAEWRPDLILCDLTMPEMDGPATLARMRETSARDIPFAFVTAGGRSHEIERLTSLGACAVIAKPFTPKGLCEAVRRLLASRAASTMDLQPDEIAAERYAFRTRLRTDAAEFARLRAEMTAAFPTEAHLADLRSVAHKLAGAAACFDYPDVSRAASALEEAVIAAGPLGRQASFTAELDDVFASIGRHIGSQHDAGTGTSKC